MTGKRDRNIQVKEEKVVADIEKLPVSVKKALPQQNRLREKQGLGLITVKVRTCLDCGKKFESVGKRICYSCSEQHKNTYYMD